MRLAMNLPDRKGSKGAVNDIDPREEQSAEVIDLASRNAFPAVTQRKGSSDALGLAGGVLFIAGLGAVTLWGMNSARVAPPEGVGNAQVAPPQAVAPAVAPSPTTETQPVTTATTQPDPSPQAVLSNPPMVNLAPAGNPFANPSLIFDQTSALVRSVAAVSAAPGPVEAPVQAAPGGGAAGDFAARVGGVGGGIAQATAMVDPQNTVTQGTLIPAILETAIDTNVPGYVRAVVSQDVRSFDGTRVLIPRSSRLIGQYQSGLQNGQKRAYVIWTRLIRPDGVSINLQSPGVGFDGSTGLEGKVSSNFFQRFGSAMLLSVVGGLSAIGSGGASVVIGGGGQAAAAAAIAQDGQVGPTIRVRPGEPIRVFTARDLGFSQVN